MEIDGRTFTESGAIIHLLLGKYEHAGLENAKKASYDSTFWSHFSEGSLMLNLQAAHTANLVNRGMSAALPLRLLPFFLRGSSMLNSYIGGIAAANVTPMLAEVDTFLADHEWFSGSSEIGEGDVSVHLPGKAQLMTRQFMMIYPLHAAMRPQWPFKLGPNTEAWVRRVEQRPAYQKASERMMKEEADQSENPPAKL